jgi:hypothetical protein
MYMMPSKLTEGKTRCNRKDPPKTAKRPIKPPPQGRPTAKWTWDWPQEEGWFWIYGLLNKEDKEFSLYPAKAYKSLAGQMSYASNGGFLYQSEVCLIMWFPITMPTMVPTPEIMYRNVFPEMFETGK